MTEHPTPAHADEDRALKSRHRAMWASGDYDAVASAITEGLGRILVEASDIAAGERVLDVATGTGVAAIHAARADAQVVASDLTPELFDAGRFNAAQHGVHIAWEEADAESLPYSTDTFDAVLSCVGVMFAPHHQAAADELVRVCRPGGTIGLLNWTPEGFFGQLLAIMKPYLPTPPPGAKPPSLWGNEAHVRGLLGDRVTDTRARKGNLRVEKFADGAAFRDFFKDHYGVTILAYRNVADDPVRTAALDHDIAELARRHDLGGGVMEAEYLLLTARVAA